MDKWDELTILTMKEHARVVKEYEDLLHRELSQCEKFQIKFYVMLDFMERPPWRITNNWRKAHHLPMFRGRKFKEGIRRYDSSV